MSIECFIRWAKSSRKNGSRGGGANNGNSANGGDFRDGLEDEGPVDANGGSLSGVGETGEKGKQAKAGSFVIEDFDAKELFNREWEVPIYGPIRHAGDSSGTAKTD